MAQVSVIIPTYQRPKVLLQALHSLQQQDAGGFEILVVDNAADPEIRALVNEFNQHAGKPAAYVPEPRLGLHFARNTAVLRASGDLLLFTDDDATFTPGWISAYVQAFREHPEMAAAGGPVRPVWEQEPPQWLLDFIGNSEAFSMLSLMDLADSFQLSKQGYFFGCNMAVRKETLLAYQGFNPDSMGDIWVGDGELGLNKKMWAAGDWIGYVPAALVYHHIPLGRMSMAYLKKRMANEGACTEYGYFHAGLPGTAGFIGRLAWIGLIILFLGPLALARLLVRRNRFAFLWFQLDLAYNLSRLRYVWRLYRDPQMRQLVLRKDWLDSGPG